MMALTHGFMALAVAALVLPALGDHAAATHLLAAAFVGGLAPDADLLASHRKTLHYPVGFSGLFLVVLAAFFATGAAPLLVAAAGVGGAALHAVSDVLGGSAEREPWNPVTENGVYNHVLGRWHRPRRYVRYSGAPEDFLVCLAFAIVAITTDTTPEAADVALFSLVAFAGGYSLCRKRLTVIGSTVGQLVPTRLRAVCPTVRVEESDTDGTTIDIRFDR